MGSCSSCCSPPDPESTSLTENEQMPVPTEPQSMERLKQQIQEKDKEISKLETEK